MSIVGSLIKLFEWCLLSFATICFFGSVSYLVYSLKFETVPYIQRRHAVIQGRGLRLSPGLAEKWFEKRKAGLKIFPASHPESVRVILIFKDIIVGATSGLVDLKWEVVVVDDPKREIETFHGGKIVVYTGLLEHMSDSEIAALIGHEELEADHIATLLIASAGYDPKVATILYEKLDKIVCGYCFMNLFHRSIWERESRNVGSS